MGNERKGSRLSPRFLAAELGGREWPLAEMSDWMSVLGVRAEIVPSLVWRC